MPQIKEKNNISKNSNKSSFSISENTTDNKGRTLSKQQQDYFKDSKVRDEDGKLIMEYCMKLELVLKIFL